MDHKGFHIFHKALKGTIDIKDVVETEPPQVPPSENQILSHCYRSVWFSKKGQAWHLVVGAKDNDDCGYEAVSCVFGKVVMGVEGLVRSDNDKENALTWVKGSLLEIRRNLPLSHGSSFVDKHGMEQELSDYEYSTLYLYDEKEEKADAEWDAIPSDSEDDAEVLVVRSSRGDFGSGEMS